MNASAPTDVMNFSINDIVRFKSFDGDTLSVRTPFEIEAFARPCHKDESWECPIPSLPEISGVVREQWRGDRRSQVLVRRDQLVAIVSLRDGTLSIECASLSMESCHEFCDEMAQSFPPSSFDDENPQAPFKFWNLGSYSSAQSRTRKLAVYPWATIADNYPAKVRGVLDSTVALNQPTTAERLLLWHGSPGTGKTHAIRALAWEWRDWCSVHFIVDPDSFFGGNANYLLTVLLDGEKRDDRWRLIVLEDTGELLSADASERSGQGLSRFLNVVDGLIGQGLRTLFLITTNEPLGKLHPAVSREGRCASTTTFEPFSMPEARAWMERRGLDSTELEESHKGVPLADLYARVNGSKVASSAPKPSSVGFLA